MKSFYHFWKIWLWMKRTEKGLFGDFSAEISTNKDIVITNKDIAERLANDGVEVSYSTLTYIIDQYDRVVRDMICEGYIVRTNNVMYTPALSGEWSKDCMEFNPEKHKLLVNCDLTPVMWQAINSTGVKVLGIKDTSSYISQVIDMTSGEKDRILSRSGDIVIEGKDIKVANKDGTTENCIFLVRMDNTIISISNDISRNESNKIVLRIPLNLEKGKYRMLIHTYSDVSSDENMTYFRCIEFDKIFSVK